MNYINDGPENQKIREGDTCVIYISEHNRNILKIEQNGEMQTKFGTIKAMELINHPYGIKYELKKGWVLPLRLTPEIWTQLLPHRTQILYQADISAILLQLDIKPNSVVIECGTGSGSLSHSILRACLPKGFLYTFDISETRADEARAEFERHGFGNNVRVSNRNVCESGFGDELLGKADACILDLPTTWQAIEYAYKTLKEDGSRLCTFSPCIEQVQHNVAKMRELKMKEIKTMECLLRPLEVRTQEVRMWNSDVLEGLTSIEQVKYDNLKQLLNPAKKAKIDEELKLVSKTEVEHNQTRLPPDNGTFLDIALRDPKAPFNPNMLTKSSYLYAKQPIEIVNHTGYLTFACKRR